MASHNLLLLPGDGIGPEVMGEVKKVADFLGKAGIAIAWADGRYSVIGAGASTLRVRTEVYADGTKEAEVALTEPMEPVAKLSLPGAALAAAIRPFRSCTPALLPMAMDSGAWATRLIGRKSVCTL